MLTAAQRSYINYLVAKEYDEKQGIKVPSSKAEFARTLDVHENSLYNWEKLPEFQDRLKLAREDFEKGRDYFAIVMRQRAQMELVQQYEKAAGTEKRHYLSMILAETKKVEDYTEIPPYKDYTDEKLIEIALEKREMLDERLVEIAKGAK